MTTGEVIDLLKEMATYWERRSKDNTHDFQNKEMFVQYMNGCAEAAVLLGESLGESDDGK